MTPNHNEQSHSHGAGFILEKPAGDVLRRGLAQLLNMTDGLDFRPFPHDKHPLPLATLAYRQVPAPDAVRRDVAAGMDSDPVSVLEAALALLELYECNQPDAPDYVLDDMPFVHACFASKRCNGWIAVIGDTERPALEAVINAKWQFKFYNGAPRPTGVYSLLNMLARYGYVYGRIRPADSHSMGHFVEEHCPGLIVCRGKMTNLELTLSLAAMKMGVPAVVPSGYPFPLGRTLRADTPPEIADAVVGFPNVRRLLRTPEIPQMPDYCAEENESEEFEPAVVWGDTPESFFVFRKGNVTGPAVTVKGAPAGPMGVIITADAGPLDAFDRKHIEQEISLAPSQMRGVKASYDGRRLTISLAPGVDLALQRVGEVLVAALRRRFPKITKVKAEIIFDVDALGQMAPAVEKEKQSRASRIASATEEITREFLTCVGCSPFAPDHVCILTPERPPQCGRSYGQIKTGALYGYDDMTNIHHSALHRDINSFGVVPKGKCLDPAAGEYEGVNDRVSELTRGRTRRVQLHSLDEFPTTGCGCFNLIMVKVDLPQPGVAVVDSGYSGRLPDGRSWKDLHYTLAGKQAPGIAGASAPYLLSAKFLKAHGGWKSVVWVTPRIAKIMADRLPPHVEVGPEN